MTFLCCGIGDSHIEKRPTSKIWVNGSLVSALWDTGADLSVISWKQYRNLKTKPVLTGCGSTIENASGVNMRVRGMTRLKYTVGKHQFSHDTVVLDGLRSNFIIGSDLMSAHGYTLDMGNRIIRRTEPLKPRGKQTVYSPKQFRIEPLQCLCLGIKYSDPNSSNQNKLYVASGQYVPQGLCEVKDGRSKIIVANASLLPIQIHRGMELCCLEDIKQPRHPASTHGLNPNLINDSASCQTAKLSSSSGAVLNSMQASARSSTSSAPFAKSSSKPQQSSTFSAGTSFQTATTRQNNGNKVNNGNTTYGFGEKCSSDTANKQNFLSAEAINLAVENVPSETRGAFSSLIKSFLDIFSKNDTDLGFSDTVEQKITLVDPNKISAKSPYKTAQLLVNVVDHYITKLLRMGVIEPSTSPWSSPLMLIRKPGVSANTSEPDLTKIWRVVHDYRLLNDNTIKDKYPLNTVFSLIDQVASGAIFTLLDVSQGYWQQSLHKDSRDYTAFSVPSRGHFRYRRCAQGLSNSGPCYQRLLDKVISGIQGCHVYIDDVIIVSDNMTDHLATLQKVFERFRLHGLKLRLSKARFATDTVTFLGYEISSKTGVRAGEFKTKALMDCKEPHSVTELRAFIGLASFFRRTIPFFSHLASPLTKLLRKDAGYSGGQMPRASVEAFHALKQELGKRPCLRAVDFKKDFICTVDSSASGSAACLSQIVNGVEHPCLYISKTNSEVESKRSAFLLEANGIIWAMRSFSPIIRGGVTKIRTDHRPLSTLCKTSTPILDKLYAELEDFSYTMEYLPGKIIPVDCLSRQSHADCVWCKDGTAVRTPSTAVTEFIQPAITVPKKTPSGVEKLTDTSKFKINTTKPKIVSITAEQLLGMQKSDQYTKSLVCYLRYHLLPDTQPLRNWVLTYGPSARIVNGIVGILVKGIFRTLAPLNLRSTLLHLGHDHELSGHQNATKTLERLSQWYWPNMRSEIEQYIRNCITCQRVNQTNRYVKLPLQPLPEAIRFNQRVHLDILGSPYPASGSMGAKYCLVICDAFSSFVRIIPVKSKSTEDVSAAFLEGYVSELGIPTFCTVDSGSEFISNLFRKISKSIGCEIRYATVGHSSANGLAENRNKAIVNYIRKYIEQSSEWVSMIPHVAFALNTSCHSDKMITPYEMVFKIKPTLAVNYELPDVNYSENTGEQLLDRHFRIQQSVREHKKEAFATQAKHYNARMFVRNFKVGDIVFYIHNTTGTMFRKFQIKWDGPAKILSIEKDGNVRIENLTSGRRFLIHCNRLKPGSANDQIYRTAGKEPPLLDGNPRSESNSETETETATTDHEVETPVEGVDKELADSRSAPPPPQYAGRITRSRARLLGGEPGQVMRMSANWQYKTWQPWKYKYRVNPV